MSDSAIARGIWWPLPLSHPRYEFLAIIALCPVLLVTCIWNGFPIIYYDTGAYALEGLGHVFLPERSAVYSLFLLVAGARYSLWFVAILQTLMTSFVLVQTIRVYLPRATLVTALGIGAALCAATGIDWYVGQIEPDCFTAIAILSVWLLAFGLGLGGVRRGLGGIRRGFLVAILALAIAAHPSHLGLAAGLLVCIALLRVSSYGKKIAADLAAPLLSWLLAV
ncbi:MAG TPA: hypothetical protein VIJ72_00835, partial [Rhizomicrobium sp.]